MQGMLSCDAHCLVTELVLKGSFISVTHSPQKDDNIVMSCDIPRCVCSLTKSVKLACFKCCYAVNMYHAEAFSLVIIILKCIY